MVSNRITRKIIDEIILIHNTNKVESINRGGCGIAALAMLRYIEKKYSEYLSEVEIVYFYNGMSMMMSENRSIIEELKENNNSKIHPHVPSHILLKLDKFIFDVEAKDEYESYIKLGKYEGTDIVSVSSIGIEFLLATINDYSIASGWNLDFKRRSGIKKLQKIYGIDLSDIIIIEWIKKKEVYRLCILQEVERL